jgi:uncharacterized membrane protein
LQNFIINAYGINIKQKLAAPSWGYDPFTFEFTLSFCQTVRIGKVGTRIKRTNTGITMQRRGHAMISFNHGNMLQSFFWPVPPSAHGGGDTGADGGLAGLINQALENITQRIGGGEQPTADPPMEWLPGLHTLANNPHPLLVHFPIAFLCAFFVLEYYAAVTRKMKLQQLSSWLLYLGAISAIITAAAGLYASKTVPHSQEVHEIMEWHGRIGLTVAGLATGLSLLRWKWSSPQTAMAKTFNLILATLMVVALFFGADLGGFMVYRYGVGVKAVQQTENHLHGQHRSDAMQHQ